jgi:hypothetical protein
MRTTLVLDDDLYRRAKAAAAHQGRTVTSVVEGARGRRHGVVPPPAELPVARESGGPLPGIDLHDARALAAVLDEGRDTRALR